METVLLDWKGEKARLAETSDTRKNLPAPSKGKRKYPPHIQKVFRWVGKAMDQFRMIDDGDRIVVGVSGVDSLSLLWILRERLNWIPVRYAVKAVYIDLGFDEKTGETIEDYLRKKSYDYEIIRTDIGIKAHEPHNRLNPCFLCSRQRRKKLFLLARDSGYNKIALGHHLEDINATLFINILYGSSIRTMLPRQDFFSGKVAIIRPLALVYKEQIQKLGSSINIPVIPNSCPSSVTSQRKEVSDFLNFFYKKDRRIRYTIFHAMQKVHKDYLPR